LPSNISTHERQLIYLFIYNLMMETFCLFSFALLIFPHTFAIGTFPCQTVNEISECQSERESLAAPANRAPHRRSSPYRCRISITLR
jgi:hypothetical protein